MTTWASRDMAYVVLHMWISLDSSHALSTSLHRGCIIHRQCV